MMPVLPGSEELSRALWLAPLSEPAAPGRALHKAVLSGAGYARVASTLALLNRMALPTLAPALAAWERWPNSIDMARHVLDASPAADVDAALARLTEVVTRENRRRRVLADACWRLFRPRQGWQVLSDIDTASSTATDDILRRVEWAVVLGKFSQAETDLAWLEDQGPDPKIAAQRIWLNYRRYGAAAVARQLEQMDTRAARVWASFFEIFMIESDHIRAPEVLARWRECPDAVSGALMRAERRLALEKTDGYIAQSMLEKSLDPDAPWLWGATDHVQWLRAGQLTGRAPVELLTHAQAACRVHPRNDGLSALERALREAVQDWADIEGNAPPPQKSERALAQARAALRLGLPGGAARALSALRRTASEMPVVAPIWSVRADAFLLAGRLSAAQAAQARGLSSAANSVQRADAALKAAEIHLSKGALASARDAIREFDACFPDRLPLILFHARLAFAEGDFAKAARMHDRFNTLKRAQVPSHMATDVRDRIVSDACAAARGDETAFGLDIPVADTIARIGAERIVASPGLSACLLLREMWGGALQSKPGPKTHIPKVIAHYWQGPEGPAVPRSRNRWSALHPDFEIRSFDAETAAAWLQDAHGSQMRDRFIGLTQPALRADLFRICWLSTMGGVFADLDEYPRLPVTPWLEGSRAVVCVERGFGSIANNFIAIEPGHPICLRTLEFVNAMLDQTEQPYAWWHTGPAQWTRAVMAHRLAHPADQTLRRLSQAEYDRRVSTNLPYPHKRGPDHWR